MKLLRAPATVILLIAAYTLSFCTTAHCESIQITSISHLDTALRVSNVRISSDPFILIWNRGAFGSNSEAQLVADAMKLAQGWNFWIDSDGRILGDFAQAPRFMFVDPRELEDRPTREQALVELLSQRMRMADFRTVDGSRFLSRLPADFIFIRSWMELMLSAANIRQMNDLWRPSKALLKSMRQLSLGLRVVGEGESSPARSELDAMNERAATCDKIINASNRQPRED